MFTVFKRLQVCECERLAFFGALRNDAVNFIRVRNVELTPIQELFKVVALVERAPEARFPRGWVWFVDALPVFAFKQRPSLWKGSKM